MNTNKINTLHCIIACPAITVPKLTIKELKIVIFEIITNYKKKQIELFELIQIATIINTFLGAEQEELKLVLKGLVSLSKEQVVSQKTINKIIKKIMQSITEKTSQ